MSFERPPIASVDEVREELRRLGYLDTGLDRFVLAGAGAASPLRACWDVAWRVGLAGGLMLGFVLTLAAVSLDRRLLSEPSDLGVLAFYLAIACGATVALAAFGGGVIALWAGRHRTGDAAARLSRDVGLIIALLGLVYLALWWRSHASGAPFAVQAGAMAVGLGLSLVLARFGSLAAVAVLSAGGGRRLPVASLSRRRLLPLLALATLCFGTGLVATARLGAAATATTPDFAVVPAGLRVRVLGIDGLERRMTEQMRGRGEMPHLERLWSTGAHGRLRAEPERVPAIVWTTIATGRGPAAHGIQSASGHRLVGMRTPVPLERAAGPFASALGAAADFLRLTRTLPPSSVLRSVKTFWNVASEKGLRVGVVNWWATWPADAVNGYLVSDRAFFKLERGGAPDREVHPPEAFERLRLLMAGLGADRARTLDRFHLAAARALAQPPPDVEALYLSGLDVFTTQRLGPTRGDDLASLDSGLAAVRDYYRFLDDLIGEAVGSPGAGEIVVVVGDPGRLSRASTAEPEGTLLLVGGPALPVDLGVASERDVAPTVLHLAGLPVSQELEGRVLEAVLSADFRKLHPVRVVSSYGARPAQPPTESVFDRQMLEELRSLGYIQ